MNKIFAAITVARQVEGEYVFIKTEKAFRSAKKADDMIKTLKAQYVTPEGKWKPQQVSTPQGEVVCMCEAGVFEIEVDDTE
jgi:uncharacterized protein YecE (DUF72 family)